MIPVAGWVAPFGDPGITDRSHLPRAFRSVPRPSSPLSAKASTRCPSSLVHRSLPQKRPHHRRAQGKTPLSRGPAPMPRRSRMKTLLEQTRSLSNAGLSASVTSSTLSSPFNQPQRRARPRRLFCASPNAPLDRRWCLSAPLRGPGGWQSSLSPVVEVNGLEPMTSCLQSRRSPS